MGNGSGRLLVFGKVPVIGLSGDYMTLLCFTTSIHIPHDLLCVYLAIKYSKVILT